jgi:large subunit ribosomal protein L18
MAKNQERGARRKKRQFRIRKKISGAADCPRLSVFRSTRHIGVQAIDDVSGRTLAFASTYEKAVREKVKYTGNKDSAAAVGKSIAERLSQIGVSKVVFDRGGNRFHGRIKVLAENAREAGLKF